MDVTMQRSTVPSVRADGDPAVARRWRTAEVAVCMVVLVSFGVRYYLPYRVTLGCALMLVTAPAWLRVLRSFRYGVTLAVLTLSALVFGAGLTIYAFSGHYVAPYSLFTDVSLVVFTFAGVGVVLWGRELLGSRVTAILFALGLMIGAGLHGTSGDLNDWKGSWAIPVTVLVLSLTYGRRWSSMIAAAALAAVSVIFDTRAHAAILVLCVVAVAWQMRPAVPSRRVSSIWTAVILATLGSITYYLGSAALVRGYLGAGAQARSIEQISTTGSLILGGRPEIAATVALIRHEVWGFGFGVMPRTGDVLLAKEGMASINYDPNNGYVDRYMFGAGFELHSVVGDVWVRMGVVGLLLLLAVLVVLVKGLAARLADRTATGLVLFLVFWSCWNFFFSPFLSSALALTLAIGLAMPRSAPVTTGPSGRRRPAESHRVATELD